MKSKHSRPLQRAIATIAELAPNRTFTGALLPDRNFPDRILILVNETDAYSFRLADLESKTKIDGGKTRICVKADGTGIRLNPFRVCDCTSITLIPTMNFPPLPVRRHAKGHPRTARPADVRLVATTGPNPRTLAAVAANWTESCTLKDVEINNCAHFLSDAFIKAGYTELTRSGGNVCITEWCDYDSGSNNPSARPIRAKEMWAWFKTMAASTLRKKPNKKGYWATFQWDKDYSGGHVLLYDSDNNVEYGTPAHWDWSDQYFYQW